MGIWAFERPVGIWAFERHSSDTQATFEHSKGTARAFHGHSKRRGGTWGTQILERHLGTQALYALEHSKSTWALEEQSGICALEGHSDTQPFRY